MLKAAKDALDVGILVSDLGACLHFYERVLGLEFIEKRPVWFGTLYRFRFGKSDFKLIDPSSKPPKGPAGLEVQTGIRYITFLVDGLTELCHELLEKGVIFEIPEKEIRPGVRVAMVKDPDGNVVEFVERS
jgi:catechol 2,3-dioxygenase-like lactoylglutathione lyase family enzyme